MPSPVVALMNGVWDKTRAEQWAMPVLTVLKGNSKKSVPICRQPFSDNTPYASFLTRSFLLKPPSPYVFVQHLNPQVPRAPIPSAQPCRAAGWPPWLRIGEEGVLPQHRNHHDWKGKTHGGHLSLWRKCEHKWSRKRVEMLWGCLKDLAKEQGVNSKEQAGSILVQNWLMWLAGPVGTNWLSVIFQAQFGAGLKERCRNRNQICDLLAW